MAIENLDDILITGAEKEKVRKKFAFCFAS